MAKCTYILLLFVCIVPSTMHGQRILQSKEFNIRNDNFYDIFSLPNHKTALYRSKESEHTLDILSPDLDYERTINIGFENKRVSIESVTQQDSVLKILYTYRDGSFHYIKVKNINTYTLSQDTSTTLFLSNERPILGAYKATTSENNNCTLLFGIEGKEMKFIVINNKVDSIETFKSVVFKDIDFRDDFRKITVTNEGKIYILFEKNNEKYNREKHKLILYESTSESDFLFTDLDLKNTVTSNVKMSYDNDSKSIVIGGLIGEKNKEDLEGYFTAILNGDNQEGQVTINNFDEELYSDLFGKNVKRRKTIRDFYIKEIIHRQDGGCILIAEMQKEFVRRSSYSTISRFNGSSNSLRGFIDYYHEDLLIFSIDSNGYESWRQVLYKKQFSQDDNGAFSSFFTMVTPSRIRILYNDEIKKSSTVSEYLLSPSGQYERNAILNTEYQELQLRFRNAEQIGANELILPSEKSGRLSIVKIRV